MLRRSTSLLTAPAPQAGAADGGEPRAAPAAPAHAQERGPLAPRSANMPAEHLEWIASMRARRPWAPLPHSGASSEPQPVQPSEAGRRLQPQAAVWQLPEQDEAGPPQALPAAPALRDIELPARMLMAGDFSAGSHHALARAARLAQAWQSRLIVAQALHAEAVQQAASEERAGLLVLGPAKDEPVNRLGLVGSVDALARRSRLPVLNVSGSAGEAYRHVVVATDFSRPSLHALRLAVRWFPGARLTLFHALWPPAPASGDGAGDAWRAAALRECATHLAVSALPAPLAAAVQCIVEPGAPEALLSGRLAEAGIDLVVFGSQGQGHHAPLGGTAENLLLALDCDTLVVRDD